MRKSRVLYLIVAVAMMVSLCTMPAGAYDNLGYVNVEIQIYGDFAWDINLDAATIASYIGNDIAPTSPYTASAYHVYYVPTVVGSHTSALTAADALLAAYLEVYGSYDEDQVHYTWVPSYSNIPGYSLATYFDVYEGLNNQSGNYYFVGSWYDNDQWYYEYYWAGEAWLLYINGVYTSMYASDYELSTSYAEFNNTQPQYIVLDYNTVQSEHFVTTTYIPGAIPAP